MITPDKIQDIRGILIEACDLHIANGGTILSSRFISEAGCCPIGCLVGKGEDSYTVRAASLLGLPEFGEDIWDFVYGFDNFYPATRSPMAALGHELRQMYITPEGK